MRIQQLARLGAGPLCTPFQRSIVRMLNSRELSPTVASSVLHSFPIHASVQVRSSVRSRPLPLQASFSNFLGVWWSWPLPYSHPPKSTVPPGAALFRNTPPSKQGQSKSWFCAFPNTPPPQISIELMIPSSAQPNWVQSPPFPAG